MILSELGIIVFQLNMLTREKIIEIIHQLTVMACKLKMRSFVFFLMVVIVRGENNNDSFGNPQANRFLCNPLQKWKTLKLRGKEIKDACIRSDYYAREPPGEEKDTQVMILVRDIKVENVDELMKTMTIDLTVGSFWEDDRIMVNYHENRTYIDLEPITKESMSELWTPYDNAPMMIPNMKKLTYVFDPITMLLALTQSDVAMQMYRLDNVYPNNISLSWSQIHWRVTVLVPLISRIFHSMLIHVHSG